MSDMLKKLLMAISFAAVGGITFFGFSLFNLSFEYKQEAPRVETAEEVANKSDIENRDKGLEALERGDYFAALTFFMSISDSSEVVNNKQELVANAANAFLTDILSITDTELDYDNFNEAKNELNKALALLPDNEMLIKKYNYVLLREELYHLCCNDSTQSILTFMNLHSNDFANDKFVAELYKEKKEEYILEVKGQIEEMIEEKNFENARQMLVTGRELVGESSVWSDIEKSIRLTEAKNYIGELKDKSEWREILDYLNQNPDLKEKYSLEYQNAFSHYKEQVLENVSNAKMRYDYQYVQELLWASNDILGEDDEFAALYNAYKDFDASQLIYCPVINQADYNVGDGYNIDGAFYPNTIQIKHSSSEVVMEFKLPTEYTTLRGTLLICQTSQYKYDEDDLGMSKVEFLDDNGNIIKSIDGISYKQDKFFEIPIVGVKYLKIRIQRDSYETAVLGISDARFY